jgi:hypothetical protein
MLKLRARKKGQVQQMTEGLANGAGSQRMEEKNPLIMLRQRGSGERSSTSDSMHYELLCPIFPRWTRLHC